MRLVKQVKPEIRRHSEQQEPCDPGRTVLTLMRIGGSRSRRAAAVTAVALLALNQCAGIAYAEAMKTVLYLDAPSVSQDRASAAGEIAEEYALSAVSPNSEVLAGLAMTAEQQSRTIEMAELPDEIQRAFDTVLSEETDAGITADAALEAGDTMLAQIEGEEDAGKEELASSDAVRPQLGGQDQPRPEKSDETLPPEYASVPIDETQNPPEPPTKIGDSRASLSVGQPEPESPPTSEEDIEYASASPDPQIIESPPDDAITDEEYGASGPITDTLPEEAPLQEEPTDMTSYEPPDSGESPQDAAELPVTIITPTPETTVQQPPVEEDPSSMPETQEIAAVSEPSEEVDQLEENGSTAQPITDTDDPEGEAGNEADVALVIPVYFPSDEEMADEKGDPTNPTNLSEEPSDDPVIDTELGEEPPQDVDNLVTPIETENEDLPLVEDAPDTTETLKPITEVPKEIDPSPNAAPDGGADDGQILSAGDENQQPITITQEPPPAQSTQGGRNFENTRPDTEARMPDRTQRDVNRSWDRQRPLANRQVWTQATPEGQSEADKPWQNQAVATPPSPTVSETSLSQIVPQETGVSAAPLLDNPSPIQVDEEIVQQQVTEAVQDEPVRIEDVETAGLVETQASPEYAEPVKQTPPAMPAAPVEQGVASVPAPEPLPTPVEKPQIQQVSEVVSDFETEVSK